MRVFDCIRAIARELWQRDNWSAELLSAMAAASYCALSLSMRSLGDDQPGFALVALLLTHVGVPNAYHGLQWFGLVVGLGQMAALLHARRVWLRGLAMVLTSWLLTGITVGAFLTRPEPGIAFAGMCLSAVLYGLAKLMRGAR